MELYSTKHQVPNVNFKEALFKGLPDDNGLYMPTELPQLDQSFIDNIENYSFQEIAFEIAHKLIGNEIPAEDMKVIIADAMNFEVPIIKVTEDIQVLELFHGPSLAFKDFGARFMSRVMAYFLKKEQSDITILVATSGDTGSAVAQGFLGMPGIKVIILYPSGKVSVNQEKQLTTLGENITALEIDGVFDDCQKLVKEAFLDSELTSKLNLSSANSINIARLIPQSFYYAWAYAQVKKLGRKVAFCTPSGNFGNLCGGLIAMKMGIPIQWFVAATNANDSVPNYLKTATFTPKPSVATISNAMDVGNPSNFPRLLAFMDNSYELLSGLVNGKTYTDDQTRACMKKVYDATGYVMCPHTAVAYLGMEDAQKEKNDDTLGIILSTAHPAKFKDVVDEVLGKEIPLPPRLKEIVNNEKISIKMKPDFSSFKQFLLG